MFCKKCGKELEDGAVFCQFCGQKQIENVEENIQKREEQISNKKLILAGTVMAVAILAVIAVFKLFVGDKGNDVADNADVEEIMETENIVEESQEEKSEEETIDIGSSEDRQAVVEETETAEPDVAVEDMQVSHMAIGENEYWFDEDGDLIKKVEEGGQTLDIQYLTDSEGNKVKGSMADKFIDMRAIAIVSNNEEFTLCCNAKGHMIKSVMWESYGSSTQSVFTYDGGNITEGHTTYRDDTGERITDILVQYDVNNNQIMVSGHEVLSFENEQDDYQYETTCIFNGDKVIKYVRDSDGLMHMKYNVEREYDNNGNLTREKSGYTLGSNNHTDETIYQYDSNGNLMKCNKVNQYEYEGVEKENSVYTDVYQYDENGNVLRQESETHRTQEGKKSSDNNYIMDYQYDINGNKVQQKWSEESLQYDKSGTVVKQSSSNRNYIWEYDVEGKLIYYSFIVSSTGNDVIEVDSEYLYDEQGRLSEVLVGGETAMALSYTDAGMLRQIDPMKEIENNNSIEWDHIETLIPEEVKTEIEYYQWYLPSIGNKKVIIEYR